MTKLALARCSSLLVASAWIACAALGCQPMDSGGAHDAGMQGDGATNARDAQASDAGKKPAGDAGKKPAGDAGTAKDAASMAHDGSTAGDAAGQHADASSGSILRTLVYHELTAGENGGPDTSKSIAYSRDGTRGLFDENINNQYAPTVVSADGSGKTGIDSVSANWIDMTAVSGDGSLVAYTTDALLISSATSPQRVMGPAVSQGSSWARFAHDPANASKWRIYFYVSATWGSPSHEPGVYSAATDGSDVMELMSPAQAAAAIGGGTTASQVYPKIVKQGLDVSADGKHFIAVWATGACTQQGEKDYILAGSTDASAATLVLGPITDGCGVAKLALSGDGNTIAYDVDDTDTSKRDVAVIGFDGTGKKMLATFPGGDDNNWGLSDDGKLLVADYKLMRTDGSESFDLAVPGGFFSSDPSSGIDLFLGALSGKGDRILYVNTGASPRRMALLEIDPADTGAAPSIGEPSLSPAKIPVDHSVSATLSVKVTSSSGAIVRVGAAVLQNGTHDDKELADVVLFDDATHGDATSGDGIYTDNELRTLDGAKPGPRTIRVRATVVDSAGRTHSTAVDFGTLTVQ